MNDKPMTNHGIGSAAMTRGVGGIANLQELARDLHTVHHSCTPAGGAGSNCPAGDHRPWAWDVGMSGYLVVWLDGWLAVKSTKIDVENS